MSLKNVDFDLNSFLEKGSIFAYKSRVWLLWGDSHKQLERPEHPSISFNEFFLEKTILWEQFAHVFEVSNQDACELLKPQQKYESLIQWKEPEFDNFSQQFDWIQSQFKNGELEKVVPYVFETGDLAESPRTLIQTALHGALKMPQGFLYGRWDQHEGVIGLTPEILIQQNRSKNFSTMAVAGTVLLDDYKKNPQKFLQNQKENHEHDWVVKDIEVVLSSMGEVKTSPRDIVETPSLAHLKTEINFVPNSEVDLEELVLKLHPTPALGVFPRNKNSETLTYLNNINERGSFGAPFGFSLSENEGLFVVAIRNIQWSGQKVRIGSGCGVVPESQKEKEWEELINKRKSVKQVFGL